MKMIIEGRLVEAHQFDGSSSGKGEIQNWIKSGIWHPHPVRTQDGARTIIHPVSPAVHRVIFPQDWVLRFEDGTVLVCPVELFSLLKGEVR